MTLLDDKNPFNADLPEHKAYQAAYALSRSYPNHNAMCGRVLGYMLLEVPWGRSTVAPEINSCNSKQKLVDLGMFYVNHSLRAFRSIKGPTPAPSDHPSHSSFDDERDMNKDIITEASQDHRTSKRQALKRDGYRCMLSGKLDATVEEDLRRKIEQAAYSSDSANLAWADAANNPGDFELAENAVALSKEAARLNAAARRAETTLAGFPRGSRCFTNAAHIFSEANNTDLGNEKKLEYASSMWAVMERFGQPGFRDELDGSKIHRLANILTLDNFLHTQFDRLALWLEAIDVSPHTYRICSTRSYITEGLPTTVTFKSYDDKFDLPDPRYIKMHAACARVAHMSGAGAYIDDIMDDLDEGRTRVLSEDGSSARILDFSLLLSKSRQVATWG